MNNKQNTKKVYYVDPNEINFINSNGGAGVMNSPNIEDLSIYFNLEVEAKGRKTTEKTSDEKYIISWDGKGKGVNFLGGSKFTSTSNNSTTNLRYLTTDGYDYNFQDIKKDESITEMFGIESIDVSYTTFFVPQITIKFIDVRGISLFAPEEFRHGVNYNGIDASYDNSIEGSFFKTFFSFPYPKYKVMIKGLYGQPITYELTMLDFKANFESTTGNYSITAVLIGYAYSLLNDITMNALLAAPNDTYFGKNYWDTVISTYELSDGGKIPKLSDLSKLLAEAKNEQINVIESDEVKNSIEEKTSLISVILDKLESIVKKASEKVNAFKADDSTLGRFISGGTAYNDENKQNSFIVYGDASLKDFTNKVNDAIKDDVEELNNTLKETLEKFTDLTLFSEINPSNITKTMSDFLYWNGEKGVYKNDLISETSIFKSLLQEGEIRTLFNDSIKKLNEKYKGEEYPPFMDDVTNNYRAIGCAFSLKEQIDRCINLLNDLEIDKHNNDISLAEKEYEVVNTTLGFKPTLYNMTAILMAHFETLLASMQKVEENVNSLIKDNKRTFPSMGIDINSTDIKLNENDVVPFPRILTDNNKTRSWLGNITQKNAPEVDFVNGLLDGLDEVKEAFDEAFEIENNLNNEEELISEENNTVFNVQYPITTLDLLVNNKMLLGETISNERLHSPWGNVEEYLNDSNTFQKYALLRAFQVYSDKDNDIKHYDGLFGEIDALNFYEKNKDIVSTSFVNTLKNTKAIWEEKKSKGNNREYDEVFKTYSNVKKYCLGGIEGSKTQLTAPRLYANLQSANKDANKIEISDYKILINRDYDYTSKNGRTFPYYCYVDNSFDILNHIKNLNQLSGKLSQENENLLNAYIQNSGLVHESNINSKEFWLSFDTEYNENETYYNHYVSHFERPIVGCNIYKKLISYKWSNSGAYDKYEIISDDDKDPLVLSAKTYDVGLEIGLGHNEAQFIPHFSSDNIRNSMIGADSTFKTNRKNGSVFGMPDYYKEKTIAGRAVYFLSSLPIKNDSSGQLTDDITITIPKSGVVTLPMASLLLAGGALWAKKEGKIIHNSPYNVKINFNGEEYDYHDKEIKIEIQNYLIKYFKLWAESSEFDMIRKAYEIGKSPEEILEIKKVIKGKQDGSNWSNQKEIEKYFNDTFNDNVKENYIPYIGINNNDSSNPNAYGLYLFNKPFTDANYYAIDLLTKVSTFVIHGLELEEDDVFNSNKMDRYVNYMVSFTNKLYEKYSNQEQIGITKSIDIKSSEEDSGNKSYSTTDDMRNALYNYLKIIYDNWLCSHTTLGDGSDTSEIGSATNGFLDTYKFDNFFKKHFYFIDTYYNRVDDEIIVNIEKVIDLLGKSMSNQTLSLLEFITELMAAHQTQFLCIQNFADFGKENMIKTAFEPISFEKINFNQSYSSDFVAVYANSPSQVLDDEKSPFKGDGFSLINENSYPEIIKSKQIGEGKGYTIPSFGVAYGSQYQNYFKDIQVGMDNAMATEQSLLAKFLISGINQGGETGKENVQYGQDLFTVYSNNSYTCTITMLGSAWVQPLMYFELLNIPMFKGAYQIKKVSHTLVPGNMITTITGVRQSKIANSRVDDKFKAGLNKKNGKKTTFANKKANIDNDCEYQFFSPFLDESDNKSLYKSVNMEQLSNWKPDWLNESGTDRRSSEDNAQYANVREAILCTLYGECIGEGKLGWQLASSVMYSQIHLHSEGLKTVLHRYRFEAFGKKEWSEVSGSTSFIETVEEIFEKSPSILVGEETEVSNPVIIYNGGVKSNLTSSNHKITLAELQQLSGYVARDFYLDVNKRLKEDNNCLLAHFYFQHKGHVFHSYTTEKDFNKNKTYWEINKTNNVNNDSKITISKTDEEKNLSDLQVGIYRALKNTLSKAESFANNEVILESGDTNFMLLKAKDETKTHLIFDALLNTYYDYIDSLLWVSEKNNTTIDYPKNVWVSVHKPVIISRAVVQTYVENGEYKTLTDFNGSLSENFKKSISKKYFPNDTNIKNFIINDNGQSKIFKKECVNFVKDENSTTEEYATLMSEVFNKVNILDCPTEPQNESSKADNAAFSDTWFKSEGVVNDTSALTEISTPLAKEIGFVVTSPWIIQRKNPATGEVRPHKGVDLAYVGNKIEGIFSLYNGTVIAVRPMKGYGNIILIAHDIFKTVGGKQKMLISLYAHMKGSTILVKASDKVKKGQKIATIGNEGIGTGAHLHFETCWWDRNETWALSLFDTMFKSNLVNPETVIVLNSKNKNFGKYIV